jgi:hypothetical protein
LCAIPLTGQVSVFQLVTSPTIDGSVGGSEWTNASVALQINNFQVGSDPGTSDISGTVRLAWDATNLYALFQITDDSRGEDSADGLPTVLNSFDDDSVELNFANTWPGTGNLTSLNNFQYRMNPNTDVDDQELETFRTGTSTGVTWSPANTGTNQNYVVEISIPWSTLSVVSPTIGNSFAFNAALNDDDDGGARETQSFWMATGTDAWFEANQWGQIQLAAAIPEPSTVSLMFGITGLAFWVIVKRRRVAKA